MKNEAIEMIKTPLSIVTIAAFCLPLLLLTSCGGDSEAMQGTTVNFDPPDLGTVKLDIEAAGAPPRYPFSSPLRIELRSPTGYAQIGAKFKIFSSYTVYEGSQTTTPLVLPYEATTGSNGTYEVTVVGGIDPTVTGDLSVIEVFSGTAFSRVILVVECGDSDTDPLTSTGACLE